MVCNGVVNVIRRFSVVFVGDDLDFLEWNVSAKNVAFHILSSLVCWCVVDINDTVVCIVLHENRVQISQVKAGLNVFIGWHDYTEWKLLLFEFINLVVWVHVIEVCLDKVLDSFEFFKLIIVVFGQLYINLSSILDIVGDLKFLDRFEELVFPDSLFGLLLSKNFFHVDTIDHVLHWWVKGVKRTFDLHFSSANQRNLFRLLFFVNFWLLEFLLIFVLFLIDFEKASNLVFWENLSWFDDFFTVNENFFLVFGIKNFIFGSMLVWIWLFYSFVWLKIMSVLILSLFFDNGWWLKGIPFIFVCVA